MTTFVITLSAVLTILSGVYYVLFHRLALETFKTWARTTSHKPSERVPPTLTIESFNRWRQANITAGLPPTKISRLERIGLASGMVCCISYAVAMLGHILFPSPVQAIAASIALAAVALYSCYYWRAKKEVCITVKLHKRYRAC